MACNETIFNTYERTPRGSLDAYRDIINRGQIKVFLYSGDWDDVVPFRDTIKNLQLLDLHPKSDYIPWKIDGQHIGFIREYPGLMFYIVKGAGHEVPQYQRAYELFKRFTQ
jgi:serine carboxypeptidase-like clade 2